MNLLLVAVVLILVLCGLFLLVITFVPLDLVLISRKKEESIRNVFAAAWGPAGLRWVMADEETCLEFLLAGRVIVQKRSGVKPEKKEKKEGVPRADLFRGLSGLFDPETRDLTLAFIRRAWQETSLREVSIRLRAGSADPAETGTMFGYFCAVRGILSPWNVFRIEMEPVFDRDVLEWEARLGFRISHLSLMVPTALRLVWKMERT